MTRDERYPALQLFIDGHWIDAGSRHLEDVLNPATGDVLSQVPHATDDDINAAAPLAGLVVNTTSIGMHGSRFETFDLGLLNPGTIVTDIVYVPLETPLLAEARARGLKTVDGLGMLLHQAVPGFEAWFGVRPQVTPVLRASVEATLGH